MGFHTRNIPHKGHEWIHEYGLNKCKNILIQPIIGQFKKGEYTEEAVLKSNEFLVKSKNNKIKNNFRYFFSFINLQPKYGGPREALLHALIRKNYGCTHFLVGRDHAGRARMGPRSAARRLRRHRQAIRKVKKVFAIYFQ